MFIHPDDLDFHYSSEAESDQHSARVRGSHRPDLAYICSDRDVWYVNPYYTGLPVPHPEDDEGCEWFHDDPEGWREANRKKSVSVSVANDETYFDDIPF